MDFYNGIPKDEATIVVIPTIVSSKEKVKENNGDIIKFIEEFYNNK